MERDLLKLDSLATLTPLSHVQRGKQKTKKKKKTVDSVEGKGEVFPTIGFKCGLSAKL